MSPTYTILSESNYKELSNAILSALGSLNQNFDELPESISFYKDDMLILTGNDIRSYINVSWGKYEYQSRIDFMLPKDHYFTSLLSLFKLLNLVIKNSKFDFILLTNLEAIMLVKRGKKITLNSEYGFWDNPEVLAELVSIDYGFEEYPII